MTNPILTTLPISTRRPGTFVENNFVDNAPGLVPLPRRLIVLAEALGGTAPVGVPVQAFSQTDGDTKLGAGTFAALGVRACFAAAALVGAACEIWAIPIAPPGGGVAAVETITLTGPATASGTLYLLIAGRLIAVGVNNGDSANTIAANVQAAIAALATTLPVTATVAASVVSATNNTKGVNGNDVTFQLAPNTVPPTGVGVAFAQSAAGAGTIDIAAALAAAYDRDSEYTLQGIITSNHTTTDIGEMLTDGANAWEEGVQSYRFYAVGCTGSIGSATALQAVSDYFPIHIMSCRDIPGLPVELAATAFGAWYAFDKPNVNMDGQVLPMAPPSGANAYSTSEIETLLAAGVTPIVPAGDQVAIVRLVTSQISVSLSNAADVELLRESASVRTTALLATNVALKVANGLQRANATDDILGQARNLIIEVDRQFEDLEYIDGVDEFLSQISAQYADAPAGRLLSTNPHHAIPPLHQVVVVATSYAAIPGS